MQSASNFLLTLDGFEQGLKIPFSEWLCSLSLDDLKEHGRSGLYGPGEDLQ